ncbi:MAG TPA: ECF transporter S component [Clostridia bacterium]|nr:ECF transporter S component [Clostridia bacterium]
MSIKKMVRIAFLAGVGFLLMFAVEFPLPFLPPFLKYDPSEVPALIAAFAWGPLTGVLVELIKSVLFFASGKATSGIIGFLGAFIAGGSYVFTAGMIYQRWRTKTGAIVSLVAASCILVVVMSVANYFILLPLWGIPTEQVGGLIVKAVVPFNLAKGLFSAVITFIIYKRVRFFLGEGIVESPVMRSIPKMPGN